MKTDIRKKCRLDNVFLEKKSITAINVNDKAYFKIISAYN